MMDKPMWETLSRLREKIEKNVPLTMPEARWLAWDVVEAFNKDLQAERIKRALEERR